MAKKRHPFKQAIAQRFVDELPAGVPYVLPDFPTKGMVGEPEWVRLRIFHNTSPRKTVGRKGARRFSRIGRIIIDIRVKKDVGPKRMDEICEAVTAMFEGRALVGFSVDFNNCVPREAGTDTDARYNLAIAEIFFEYREVR